MFAGYRIPRQHQVLVLEARRLWRDNSPLGKTEGSGTSTVRAALYAPVPLGTTTEMVGGGTTPAPDASRLLKTARTKKVAGVRFELTTKGL